MGCNGACKERSVYRAALERGKKQPIKYKKEKLVCMFLQGKVNESNTRKKVIAQINTYIHTYSRS